MQEICQVHPNVILIRKESTLTEIPSYIAFFFLEIIDHPDHLQCWQLRALVNVFRAAFIQFTANNF